MFKRLKTFLFYSALIVYMVFADPKYTTIIADAVAAPPEAYDTNLGDWYKSLTQPNGVSCCDISDCRRIEYRINKDGYEVRVEDRWWPVPQDRVLNVSNPTGNAVLCYRTTVDDLIIYCFVPDGGV
jgi:hypothetical protein